MNHKKVIEISPYYMDTLRAALPTYFPIDIFCFVPRQKME
jgi:hypothetical protein